MIFTAAKQRGNDGKLDRHFEGLTYLLPPNFVSSRGPCRQFSALHLVTFSVYSNECHAPFLERSFYNAELLNAFLVSTLTVDGPDV